MKKYFVLLLTLVLLVTSVYAGGSSDSKGLRVASLNAVVEGNPYRAMYEDQLAELSDDLKAKGIISEYTTYVANSDPALERQYLEQAINDGVDIIIVNPIANGGLDDLITMAKDSGIVYINADNIYDHPDVINVVVNQAKWAEIQSDFVVETLGPGSKVVHFKGIEGNSASEIRDAVWTKAFADANIEVVKKVAHGWNDTVSKDLMSEIISSGIEFDGIINEESANGILDAIEEANIPYPGTISSSEEVAWIRRIAEVNKDAKNLPFIVVENPPGIGATALSIGVALANGKEFKDDVGNDGVIMYDPQWVMTYENMEEKVAELEGLPDSVSVSNYLNYEEALDAYFK